MNDNANFIYPTSVTNPSFRAALDRMLTEAYEHYAPALDPPSDGPALTVHKHSAFLQLSIDQLLDAGLITEEEARAQGWTPYAPPPIPWHRRLRWRWQAWREHAVRRVGGWIAGMDLSERDEDW